jgi:LysR family transcriptional regulator, nitrogen assimilation regulatory protein
LPIQATQEEAAAMQLTAAKLFLEVAESGSLSKVAARRQTAQSHVSRQITDFESRCGGRLFRRTGRGVQLTDLGERAAARLASWVHETERLEDELREAANQVSGVVRLGIIPSAAHPLTTHAIESLRSDHPGIRLDVSEAQGSELDALLDSGAVDLAIVFRHQRPSTRDETPLCVAGTYLVSARGDALTRARTIAFAKLEGLRLVLPRRPSHWRNALDDTARSLGFKLDAVAEADSLTVQRELVANTSGVYSVLGPYSIAEGLRAGRLQASKLVRPELVRHVTLAFPKHGKLSPATRIVAQCVEGLVKRWGRQLTLPRP